MSHGKIGSMAPGRRKQLLRTAAREFAASGYERASLNRIIRACGMSKSSFYYYFESKQELFERVVEHLAEALVGALDLPSPNDFAAGAFWTRVSELLGRLTALADREPLFVDLGRMFYLPGAPTGNDSAVGRMSAAVETWLNKTLAVGRKSGAVRRDIPADLQARLTVAVVRVFDEWTMTRTDLTAGEARRLAEAQLDTLKRFLADDR